WYDKGDFDKATKDNDEAIRLDPEYMVAYYHRGIAWQRKGGYDRAINDFNEAIRLDPEYVHAYNRCATVWLAKKDYGEAIHTYEQAIRLVPDHPHAYGGLALLLATCPESTVRDGKRAIRMVAEACRLSSTSPTISAPWVLAILAAAYAEAGQFDEAVRYQ